jgi:peroxiredoxin (alkyl hydroperoxide reductase subunit C)
MIFMYFIHEGGRNVTHISHTYFQRRFSMLTVGDKFPEFSLHATVSRETGKEFAEITEKTNAGNWQVIFFWPEDFTFVCPTEIAAFGQANESFEKLNAKLLGGSTDSRWVHLAWRENHPDLKDLPFPMLADVKHELCSALGILDKTDGVALRATFIVDPEGIIRWVSVNDLQTGRSVEETLRVLEAMQTGQRTPCGWTSGDDTLG